MTDAHAPHIVALTGGVGGAKLAHGLHRILPPGALTCIVNTGDDFEHLGLHVSPDVDTLIYTLAGAENRATGWGRRDETWTFMGVLEKLGGPSWFRLGDGDLALHVERSRRLARGERLSSITDHFRRSLGVTTTILPMSDSPVRTKLKTVEAGELSFQDYFVRECARPTVTHIHYSRAELAEVSPEIRRLLTDPRVSGIVICPSNPFLSVAPILAVSGMRQLLQACVAPVVAVSPLIMGKAIKGPTAKLMDELGLMRSSEAIAVYYEGLIDGLVIDERDAADAAQCGIPVLATPTLMDSISRREQLATRTLEFLAEDLHGR